MTSSEPKSGSLENQAQPTQESGTTASVENQTQGQIETENTSQKPSQTYVRDRTFWVIIFVINISYFVALLETSIVATPLPTILHDLNGNDFIWVGTAYTIAVTALMPLTGGLCEIFGRKPAYLSALFLFSVGSLLCALAHNMALLIAGRAVQGAGGSGLLSISTIVLSDIVPLSERGTFNGIIQLTWCIAAGIGPVIGGALSKHTIWRWIFYINLPIAGIASLLVIFFMKLKTPEGSLRQKLARIDWLGNALIIASTCSLTLGLTWGGSVFSWGSHQVLVPLCLGVAGICAFAVYETLICKTPIVPAHLLTNRTSLSGYVQNSLAPIPFFGLIYYIPTYLQACKGVSPLRSGVIILGLALSVAPVAALTGIVISVTKKYRPQIWVGWVLGAVGLGLLGSTDENMTIARFVGYEILVGAGFGMLWSALYFPVLAAVPVTSTAHALSFFAFLRQLFQIWGIAIGGTIIQNKLQAELPSDLVSGPRGSTDAFQLIPILHTLDQASLNQSRKAFADGFGLFNYVGLAFAGTGLLASLLMKDLPLHETTDKKWDIKRDEKEKTAPNPDDDHSVSVEAEIA